MREQKDLVAIFSSGRSITYSELLFHLDDDPGLVHGRYIFDRTILHYLVIWNQPDLLFVLLQEGQFKQFSKRTDKYGETILHYVLKDVEGSEQILKRKQILIIIINFLPEIINALLSTQ